MEDAPRGPWDGEAKAVQQCLTDIFTSVYTTCDIPENAIFGPCVLSHTSLYDSIAFIALKSTDKRTVPYIFRVRAADGAGGAAPRPLGNPRRTLGPLQVDTSAANGSAEGLMWLRLVQAARERQEQNLEAYVKSGQLFYRSLRRIAKDEELLVWYGKELAELLLLGPARGPDGGCPPKSPPREGAGRGGAGCPSPTAALSGPGLSARPLPRVRTGSPPFSCPECGQRFQFELPFAAHLRFRCPKRLHGTNGGPPDGKEAAAKEPEPAKFAKPLPHPFPDGGAGGAAKPSTDFHNLARELENPPRRPDVPPEGAGGGTKRRYPEEEARGRFPTERPGLPAAPKEEPVCAPQQQFRAAGSYCGPEEGGRLFAPPSPETGEAKRSAFVEVKKAARGPEPDAAPEDGPERSSPAAPTAGGGGEPALCPRSGGGGGNGAATRGSAFSSVPQLGAAGAVGAEERKSAFSQPARCFPPLPLGPKLGALGEPCPDGPSAGRLYAAELAAKEGAGGGAGAKQSPFLYATAFWPKSSAAAVGPLQLQLPSALTLLPPSFASLCLPAQNWCAKCNASFRMTSDLVYHMRSHHKKEYALEPLVKRRREEKLKCPICNESFRERHHLSRHMTSHN